jgi:uncharacterized membrane protein YkvA (DUF1232 family)
MNLQIKFELTDTDLDYFRSQFREAQKKLDTVDTRMLVQSARALVDSGLASDPPEFVRKRLNGLGGIVRMVEDETWQMPDEDHDRVMQVLAYFVDPDDIIADDVPVLGLIDDAIAIELAIRQLQHEIEAYEEFSEYRNAETQRRVKLGQTTDVSKEDWLADRRAALHSRMRERSSQQAHGWRYTTF